MQLSTRHGMHAVPVGPGWLGLAQKTLHFVSYSGHVVRHRGPCVILC